MRKSEEQKHSLVRKRVPKQLTTPGIHYLCPKCRTPWPNNAFYWWETEYGLTVYVCAPMLDTSCGWWGFREDLIKIVRLTGQQPLSQYLRYDLDV